MLAQVARHVARRGLLSGGSARPVATSTLRLAEAQSSKDDFLAKFDRVADSMLSPPHFPSEYLPKEETAQTTGMPSKLQLNFYLPHDVCFKNAQIDLVLIPAVTGDFGVMPGHVPTVAQLRPGVVTVHKELDKVVEKWFVSSGFAFVHADSSADVCAVEAVKVEELNPDAVRAGLQEYTAKLAATQASGDDYEIAAAQIGVEVYSAMNAAIGA